MRILVTRPEPECERTAALLRSRGHEVLVLPLLRIEAVADAELGSGPWAAVLFTSVNAVRAIAAHRRFGELAGLPAFVVGPRSRTAAVSAGFSPVVSADGDMEDLVRLIASNPPVASQPLLYCAGDVRAGDLAGVLQAHGLRADTAVVYRSVMVTNLKPDVRAALAGGKVDAVLHYSARTADAFVAAVTMADVRDLSMRIRHLCLSAQVAAPLAAAGAAIVKVAGEPNERALLGLVGPV